MKWLRNIKERIRRILERLGALVPLLVFICYPSWDARTFIYLTGRL